jgi:hypothetical protein
MTSNFMGNFTAKTLLNINDDSPFKYIPATVGYGLTSAFVEIVEMFAMVWVLFYG